MSVLGEMEELMSTDLSIKELHITPGRLDLSATHPLAASLTAALVSVFKSAGAENYFEMEAFREDVGPIVITIQRREGKTPGRIAAALKDQVAVLKADNEGMLNAGGYAYMSDQRDKADQRSYQAVAYAEEMKTKVSDLEKRLAVYENDFRESKP
jgi:uncharacterized protein YceH (UPF0502 family)